MVRGTVERLRQAAALLDETGQRLGPVDPGPTAFGVGGLGVLGEVGREAYRRWQAALDARSREAVAHAARVAAAAALAQRAGQGLADGDAESRQGSRPESPHGVR